MLQDGDESEFSSGKARVLFFKARMGKQTGIFFRAPLIWIKSRDQFGAFLFSTYIPCLILIPDFCPVMLVPGLLYVRTCTFYLGCERTWHRASLL